MGAKNEVSAPHPAAALSWRVASIRPALQGGGEGDDGSLTVTSEGLRDVWRVSGVRWCVTGMGDP